MKPHIKPTTKQLRLNSAIKRLPFYSGGAGHLAGTKHSKAWGDYSYPLTLDFWFFWAMYKRVGLAKGGIERPADMCWLTNPMIKRGDKQDGEQAQEFEDFAERLDLWPNLKELDYMQRVGHYAGLFIRVADGKRPDQALEATSLDKIIDLTPCWEGQLTPNTLDQDPASPRYGMPISYTYQQNGVQQTGQRDGNETTTIHWTRVLIWNEGAAGNTIYGESAMESVYNSLIDWEKIRGAGGEGFWKQASLRAVLESLPETAGQAPSDEEMDSLIDAITEMQSSFDNVPYLGGMKLNTMQTKIDRPDGFKDIVLEDIAAGFKWSAKGLIGAQEGRLAGDQDSGLDKQTAQSRRESFLTIMIKRLLKWLNDYTEFDNNKCFVEWSDLMSPSDRDRLENADKMSQINERQWRVSGDVVYSVDELREITEYERVGMDDLEMEDRTIEEEEQVRPDDAQEGDTVS